MALYQEKLITTRELVTRQGTDVATSGSLNNVATSNTSFLRLTAATGLTGLANGEDGKCLTLTNANSADLLIGNESASSTAANRIITGTGGDITLSAGGSLELKYDATASRWRVLGGTSGGFSVASTQNVTSGGTITLAAGFFQTIPGAGSGSAQTASTTPFGATPPLNGTVIRLLGTSNANPLTIQFSDASNGCLLGGDAALGRGSVLDLQYISSLARYVEVGRNSILGV